MSKFAAVSAFRMLPLFVAVNKWRPDFKFSNVNIIANRGHLLHLLNWILGIKTMFRIDTQLVNSSTLLLSNKPIKLARKSKTKNLRADNRLEVQFGRKFEKSTTAHPKGFGNLHSMHHHRIISYVSTGFLFSGCN